MSVSDREARWSLACVSEPGDVRLQQLLLHEGPVEVWRSLEKSRAESVWARRRQGFNFASVRKLESVFRLRFITPEDAEWPERLNDLKLAVVGDFGGAPLGLWLRGPGDLGQLCGPAISIVGSRAATHYGETVAAELAAELAEQRQTIVSGGAYGIDACAHRGALAVDGRTVCVQACGVDQPYPRGNKRIFDELVTDHLVVSELPPGLHPTRSRFLARNRIIAALGEGTLIVEAAVRSGARNTVSWANNLGRQVMAVPGPVQSAMSETPHQLIRDQEAILVANADQVRELVAPVGQDMLPFPRGAERVIDGLDEIESVIFEAVPGRGGVQASELCLRSGFDLLTVLTTLASLEERRLVHAPDGLWKLVPGSVR